MTLHGADPAFFGTDNGDGFFLNHGLIKIDFYHRGLSKIRASSS